MKSVKMRQPEPATVPEPAGGTALVLAPDKNASLIPSLVATAILLPIALLGPNTQLALLAWLTLLVGLRLLFRPGEPPILLLIFGYQWIQAAIGLYYGNLRGLDVNSWTEHGGQDNQAILLTLIGLNVLAISIRIAAGRSSTDLSRQIRSAVAEFSLKFWFTTYGVAWLFSFACLYASTLSDGLRQPMLFMAQIKWAAFFLLTIATFGEEGETKFFWVIAFALEFASSIGGYFSSFSDVFMYAIIGLAASNVKISLKNTMPLAIACVAMIFFGIIWSGIKHDYRVYASKGVQDQVVRISTSESIAELTRLIGQIDAPKFGESADILVQRLMYFEFFGVVLDRVPAGVDYSGGEIWGTAILSPFTPRLLFPDKQIINDTHLTEKYTGIHVAAWGEGTSISIGYMAEAYIDFGPWLMFIAIAALGLFMGGLYRWLLSQKDHKLAWGAALAPVALMPARALESSSLKVIPPLVLSLIGCWLVLATLGPMLLRLLEQKRRTPIPRRRRVPAAGG